MTRYDEQLSRELRSRADDVDGHPIALDAVKRRAHRMKWQRRAATGTLVAAFAVAIPAGIVVVSENTGGGRSDLATPPTTSDSSGPATDSPTPSSTTDTASTQPSDGVKKVVLTADIERHGGEPQIVTSFDDTIIDINGNAVPIGEMWTEVVRNGETPGSAWMGLAWDNDGNTVLKFASADGSSISEGIPVTRGLAISPPTNADGSGSNVAYYSLDDDTLHLISSTGNFLESWPFAQGTEVVPVGVLDGGVVYNVDGRQPVAMLATSGGGTQPILGLRSVRGVYAPGNLVSGVISVEDFGSCSAVVNAESGKQLWKTCDYTLGAFSPDGKYIIGNPPYIDGIGDGLVAILDAKTGDPIVEYDTKTRQGSLLAGGTVWDTDGTLLAMLYDDGWALMRLDTDGVFSNVSTGRIAGAPEDLPLFFGARP
jgi:hypothetical protein